MNERLGETDEAERGPEVLLGQALVAQHHRERRTGDRRHRVEQADAAAEHEPDRLLRSDRSSIAGGLKQDEREQRDERPELQPAGIDLRHQRGAEQDARQQSDDDGQDTPPHAFGSAARFTHRT